MPNPDPQPAPTRSALPPLRAPARVAPAPWAWHGAAPAAGVALYGAYVLHGVGAAAAAPLAITLASAAGLAAALRRDPAAARRVASAALLVLTVLHARLLDAHAAAPLIQLGLAAGICCSAAITLLSDRLPPRRGWTLALALGAAAAFGARFATPAALGVTAAAVALAWLRPFSAIAAVARALGRAAPPADPALLWRPARDSVSPGVGGSVAGARPRGPHGAKAGPR